MTVNASAHKLQILVGADNQDWSAALISFEVGDSERDDSGRILQQGKLKLAYISGAPDSMNPRTAAGRARWFKGQQIIVNVTKAAGNFVRHPRGWLYIAKPPLPPSKAKPYLELDLVCVLQLRNFPQPRGPLQRLEVSPSALPGTLTNSLERTALISTCFSKAGITNSFVGSVPKHPVFVSLYKDDPGGYPDLAGKLAYGGRKTLCQQRDSSIDAVDLAIARNTPLLTVEIGKDEIFYEHIEGGETPVEKVVFNATLSYTVKTSENSNSVRTDKGDGAAVDPALLGSPITVREVTTSENITDTSKILTELVRAPLGMVSPVAFPKVVDLGLDSETITTWNYGADGGKLSQKTIVEKGLFPKLCAEFYSRMNKTDQAAFANTQVTKEDITTYEYDGDVIKTISRIINEPIGAIISDEKLLTPGKPATSFLQTITYYSPRQGEWTISQTTLIPAIRLRSDLQLKNMSASDRIAVKGALITDPKNTFTDTSNSGQNQPPAAERVAAKTENRDKPIEGVATFTVANSGFDPRERPFTLDTGVAGGDQLTELAQIEGALLIGRAQGARIQLPLLDQFLDNPQPLQNIAVIETEVLPTGKKKNLILYQMDGLEFTHNRTQALVTATLIWIGTIEGSLVPHSSTPPQPAFTESAVVAPYTTLMLDNSESVSVETVVVPPPIVVQPTQRGFGFGRPELELLLRKPLVPITADRGFGFSRALTFAIAPEARGFGLGRGDAELQLRLTSVPIITGPRGFGVGRPEAVRVPIPITSERGFGVGKSGDRLWGLGNFEYSGSTPDTNGIIYFAGTNFGQATWSNPHNASRLIVAYSTTTSGTPANLVDRAVNTANRTNNTANSWMRVDFGLGRSVRPVFYVLQHDNTAGAYLRTWKLQGSNDTSFVLWDDLDVRTNDTTINAVNAFGGFAITPVTTSYRYLRVLQTDVNSDGTNTLVIAEFEVYGIYDY